MLSWFGIISLMMALIPVVAISADPALHRHADRLAGVPGDARTATRRRSCWRWCRRSPPGASCRSTTRSAPPAPTPPRLGFDKLGQAGVLYQGLDVLGGGAILAGIILGAIAVFIIERDFAKAAAFACAGAHLTFFGLIHGEAIGIGQSPSWR